MTICLVLGLNTFRDVRETIGEFDTEKKLEYFRKNKEDLSYITAIEKELNIDLSELIN